jgi:hypothetical protein
MPGGMIGCPLTGCRILEPGTRRSLTSWASPGISGACLTSDGPAGRHTGWVASWRQFEAEAPALAEVAARLWPGSLLRIAAARYQRACHAFAVAYIASFRRDRGPRLHPFCPVLAAGRLFAAIPQYSPKRWDLSPGSAVCDPRIAGPRRRRVLHAGQSLRRDNRCDGPGIGPRGGRQKRCRRRDRISYGWPAFRVRS